MLFRSVATPSALHGPDTKKALKKGKHVLVEKPMAMTPSEAKGMIELAKQVDRKLFVHQNYRFFRNFTYLQDVVNSGILGKIYHLRCYINAFGRRNDWQCLVKNGGGVLNNTCPHFIDQICQLLGAPVVQVMGDLQQIASAGDVEDHTKAFMRAANGVTADMEITNAQKVALPLPRWIIAGSTGTLTVTGENQATIHYFDPAQAPKLEVIDGAAAGRKYGNDDKLPWQVKEEKAEGTDVGNYYDDIFNVLRNGKTQRVTPESVLHVMEVIAMIRKGTNFPGKVVKPKLQPA